MDESMTGSDPQFETSVRDYVASTLGQASGILESALQDWLAETIARLIIDQPLPVMLLKPAALSALKRDYGRVCDQTIAEAGSMIKDIDLAPAAREALGYPTDQRLLDFDARIHHMLGRPIGVLAGGGFKVEVDDIQKGEVLHLLGVSIAIALQSYGRNVLGLQAVSADNAKNAWDRA